MWYYQDGSERKGPVDTATIKSMMASGSISIDTLVWKTGMSTWVALQQTELAAELPAPPPVVPTPGAGLSRGKSRVGYILLAILLGCGVHNFYAGYSARGVVQLLVALIGGIITCGVAWGIIWIWSIVEACTVTVDSDGVPME